MGIAEILGGGSLPDGLGNLKMAGQKPKGELKWSCQNGVMWIAGRGHQKDGKSYRMPGTLMVGCMTETKRSKIGDMISGPGSRPNILSIIEH